MTFAKPAIVLAQPNTSSTSLRLRWLTLQVSCQVVQPSIDDRLIVAATCGVTHICHNVTTNSAVPSPLPHYNLCDHQTLIMSTAGNTLHFCRNRWRCNALEFDYISELSLVR